MNKNRQKDELQRKTGLVAMLSSLTFASCYGFASYLRSQVRNPDMAIGFALRPEFTLVLVLGMVSGAFAIGSGVLWWALYCLEIRRRRNEQDTSKRSKGP